MDRRRAAGALFALAVCVASADAAPTASNQTALDLYDGAAEGCYYNFQHYGEGDRIMTNEPCLNCTCHNRMLMCYLRVCPFTKPIGQDCTVEKRADQCCPIVTCPDVPVDLLTSTSTTSPAEYGATGVGKLDKYGCSINGKYFPEGSKVPPTPNKPCEHCYCIRNMTTCVMQECTLHVDGCTPIYHKDVCCPVRYSCDHPEDEMLLLDDMTTTVRPTPGFLLTTTTLSPVTQMSQDCVHEDKIVSDGALIKTEKACEHCYCMKGDIVCVVQECGTPMENEGKNCTSQLPREGQCCPDTYICEGDEMPTELPSGISTELPTSEEITTLVPPRRVGVEGSGYRKEVDESYTEVTPFETDTEGSGFDHGIEPTIDTSDEGTAGGQTPEVTSDTTEDFIDIATTTKTSVLEEIERTTEPDKGLNTVPSGLFDEETPETSMPQRTTISDDINITEPTVVSEDNKDEDKTNIPDMTSSTEITHKGEEIPRTTETTVTKDDESNEVTGMIDHTEAEKLSTSYAEPTAQTTSQYEPVTSETESKSPLVGDSEVKSTTELYTNKYEPTEDKETSTQSLTEMTSSAETMKPPSEITSGEIVKQDESTTESIVVSSSLEEITKTEDDIVKQEEMTTESLSDSPTSTKKPLDVDISEETEVSTQQPLEFSTPTKTVESIDETSSDEPLEEKITTTESSLEVSTKSEPEMPSVDESVDTPTKKKEFTTEPSLEILTSSESTKLPEEVSSNAVKESEVTTETSLELSSQASDKTSDEETIGDKELTTEPWLQPSTSSKETKPFEIPTTPAIGQIDEAIITTEKSSVLETTSIDNKENEVEDIARIPGEGDCLVNSITYRNNSDVPSTNNCHTGCKCVSSIVKCDPIICSPPPEYMDNCQPIYDSPDSCCPTYICHSGETMPPQPDSHMSGTEKPVTSSTLECHGDQCVIKQEESPASSDKPVVSDCGSASCGDEVSSDCGGNGCALPTDACAHGNCQGAQPEKPCHEDNCDVEPVITPVENIPLCHSKDDCKPQTVPCEGNACVNVECNSPDCSAGDIPSVNENEEKSEVCTDSSDCQKQEDKFDLPCSGDSCKMEETDKIDNQLPVDCAGSECEKQKPDTVTGDKVDIQTDMPMKEIVPETVTQPSHEEPLSKTPEQTGETLINEYEQTPSSEPHSTTSAQSSEQSTLQPDLVDKASSIDTSATTQMSESSAITTESHLATDSLEVKISDSEPTSPPEDTTSSIHSSVTQAEPLEETTQAEEEITKTTVISPEISEQTIKLPQEQLSTSEEPVTLHDKVVTDKPSATLLPEVPYIPTRSQETSVTDIREPTTVSSVNVESEATDAVKPDASTETSITTQAIDKEISESPEQQTLEPQHNIDTTEDTTVQKLEVVTTTLEEEEKESVTASTVAQSDESTIKVEAPVTETSETQSHVTDLLEETHTSTYEPSHESSSMVPHEVIDTITTSESPQEIDYDKTESSETAYTSIPQKTESENDIVPTEATEKDKNTIQEDTKSTFAPEIPALVSTTTPEEEKETQEPFTNKPVEPTEEETKIPVVPVTEENIAASKPEKDISEEQEESQPSDMPATVLYETVTPSEEITPQKHGDTETKLDLPVTDGIGKETDTTEIQDTRDATTESSMIKHDDQSGYTEVSPAVPTTLAVQEDSSTSQAPSTDKQTEYSTTPTQNEITVMPLEKDETTEKVSVDEIPERSSVSFDGMTTEKPLSVVTDIESVVTEISTSKLMHETTEPQPISISEGESHTGELPHVTDKAQEEQDSTTEVPYVTESQEPFTNAQIPEEPPKTTFVPKLTQPDIATEISQTNAQTTTSEYESGKEGSTESSVPTHAEVQDTDGKTTSSDLVTPSSEAPVTESQTSKEFIDNTVTENELQTEEPLIQGTISPVKLFTTESPEFQTTKIYEDITKLYEEQTEIPVKVTEQEKEKETTDTSELGPKIKDPESELSSMTTSAPFIDTDAEKENTQPEIVSVEISTKSAEPSVTESTITMSTNIPESHIKDEVQKAPLPITTISDIPSSSLQEESTQPPKPTMSELQTEELLEVTSRPQQLSTEEPQAKTTLSMPEATEYIHKEISTDSLLEFTTEKGEEILTELPQEIATEEPQVELTTRLTLDTSVELQTETEGEIKQTSTEKMQEPSVTETMIDVEKTTLKSEDILTEIITKQPPETAESELEKTESPIEQTTKSIISDENEVPKEPEMPITSVPKDVTTEVADVTVSDEQLIETTSRTMTDLPEISTSLPEELITKNIIDKEIITEITETSTSLPHDETTKTEVKGTSESKYDVTETTPYVVELEEHTHKNIEESSTILPEDQESVTKSTESVVEVSTEKGTVLEEETPEYEKDQTTPSLPSDKDSEKSTPSLLPTDESVTQATISSSEIAIEKQDEILATKPHDYVPSTSGPGLEISNKTEKTPSTDSSQESSLPEDEILPITSQATTTKVEEYSSTSSPTYKPEEKPAEFLPPTAIPETPKPGLNEVLPTDEIPEDDGHFPPSGGASGYGQEPDYAEEDQAFGPGTCRYGGKVYVSAQQIPRDDPCDFCFCFRSDIICLQQSCPPPIHGCHEEPIQGFCCPRYECPVAMATSLNVTTTTTTTTTTLPPHFLPHAYKGAAQRRGCQIKGHTYKVGEVVRASSGPCLHCTCGGDGQMKCDPKACTPEPMLRQMIAAAVSAKRRR